MSRPRKPETFRPVVVVETKDGWLIGHGSSKPWPWTLPPDEPPKWDAEATP